MTPRVSLGDTLVRNTVWYGLVTVLGLGVGLAMSVILARGLGPARMGDYSYLLWAERTFSALATLGFALATVRYTADAFARGNAALAWGFVRFFLRRQVVSTSVVMAAALPLVLWAAPPELRWPFGVVLLALFPLTLENVYTNALYGAQRYDLTARNSTLKMTLQLLAATAAVVLGAGILGIVVGMVAGTVVSLVLQRRRVRALYPSAERGDVPAAMMPELRGFLVPLSVVVILDALVWDRSEVFFLRLYASPHDIAFYSLAFGLTTRAMVLPEVAAGALLPALSTLHGRGAHADFGRVYRTALGYVALIGSPIAAIGAALAYPLVTLLYGAPYLPVAQLVGALAIISVVAAMRKVAWAALRALGDRRHALRAMWLSAALNVGCAAWLIPMYGTWGAVVANSAAQLAAALWAFCALARAHGCRFPTGDIVRTAGAAGAAFGVAWGLAPRSVELPRMMAAGAGGLVVFLILAVVAGVLGHREWAFLVGAARRMGVARPASIPISGSGA